LEYFQAVFYEFAQRYKMGNGEYVIKFLSLLLADKILKVMMFQVN